jgi:hypothetical protein
MAIQDKVFLAGAYIDPTYAARREPTFVVAINCGQAGGTCFCVSMQIGPRASSGFDLALTEVLEGEQHYFLTEVRSTRGAAILHDVPHREAQPEHLAMAERIVARTATQMGRSLDMAAAWCGRRPYLCLHGMEHEVGHWTVCGHCQFGPIFLCKDGPVLVYDRIKQWFGKRKV